MPQVDNTTEYFSNYQLMSAGHETNMDGRLDDLETTLNRAEEQRLGLIRELEERIKALEYELNKANAQVTELKGLNPLYRANEALPRAVKSAS
jgi:uncharacterized protein YPO0396